eukprot:766037-Hanusia_phi.AAC.3
MEGEEEGEKNKKYRDLSAGSKERTALGEEKGAGEGNRDQGGVEEQEKAGEGRGKRNKVGRCQLRLTSTIECAPPAHTRSSARLSSPCP